MTLQNRIALITGSSSGIGRAVALAMATAGADIVINHPTPREADAASEIADQICSMGRRALVIEADIAEASKEVRKAQKAAITAADPDITDETVDKVLDAMDEMRKQRMAQGGTKGGKGK